MPWNSCLISLRKSEVKKKKKKKLCAVILHKAVAVTVVIYVAQMSFIWSLKQPHEIEISFPSSSWEKWFGESERLPQVSWCSDLGFPVGPFIVRPSLERWGLISLSGRSPNSCFPKAFLNMGFWDTVVPLAAHFLWSKNFFIHRPEGISVSYFLDSVQVSWEFAGLMFLQ